MLAWPVAAMVVHLGLTALFGPRDPEPEWDAHGEPEPGAAFGEGPAAGPASWPGATAEEGIRRGAGFGRRAGALASAVGGKRAAMADPAGGGAHHRLRTGPRHPSPLGQRKRLRTVLDASAGAHPTICVSAGRRGLEVELSPQDLTSLTDAVLAPVGRG